MASSNLRFVALDVHKHYLVVGAVDATKQIVLTPRRVEAIAFSAWAQRYLRPTDQVVLEAGTTTWRWYDLLVPLVARVVVAEPRQTKARMALTVKTDRRDTLGLAMLLAVDLIPAVWVPPPVVRDLRALIAHRQRLISQRTAAKNRLRSLLDRRGIVPPSGDLFALRQRAWWTSLDLPSIEQVRMTHDRATITHLDRQIADAERELARQSIQDPWRSMMPFIMQLPGMGLILAMTILSAIGEITRFPSAKQLVGYSGLGADIHASGQTHWAGGITKCGRRELRTALVEVAWTASRTSPYWKTQFDQLGRRIGTQKAIVALARKLLVVIWHILTEQASDRHADAAAIGRRFARWGSRYGLALSVSPDRLIFLQQMLAYIGLDAAAAGLITRVNAESVPAG